MSPIHSRRVARRVRRRRRSPRLGQTSCRCGRRRIRRSGIRPPLPGRARPIRRTGHAVTASTDTSWADLGMRSHAVRRGPPPGTRRHLTRDGPDVSLIGAGRSSLAAGSGSRTEPRRVREYRHTSGFFAPGAPHPRRGRPVDASLRARQVVGRSAPRRRHRVSPGWLRRRRFRLVQARRGWPRRQHRGGCWSTGWPTCPAPPSRRRHVRGQP